MTVRLHDSVVSQEVFWCPRLARKNPIQFGEFVPTPSGQPLGTLRWTDSDGVEVTPLEPTVHGAHLTRESRWHWTNGAGVSVDLDLVPRIPARRTSEDAWGDIALLVFMLTLVVGVAQINYMLGQFLQGIPTEEGTFEPTPELIARLLQEDFAGQREGRSPRVQRPDARNRAPSFFLPAGSEGSWDHMGGGENIGRDIQRNRAEAEEALAGGVHTPLMPLEAIGDPELEQLLADLDTSRDDPSSGHKEHATSMVDLPVPMERFVGWGFRDWFDVRDGRPEVVERMSEQLAAARVKLAIDPDDPYAIQTAAYYAYLAERYDLCEVLYARFIRLYPDEPSGYNNLALVLKRSGAYGKEEALYRMGLALEPQDLHIINNLAVNLAHQGRFDEATQLMDHIGEVTPDDAYADLHRAKVHAAMGHERRSLQFLRKALRASDTLDTLHHIEFRQDIRLDPAFAKLRQQARFRRILEHHYGDNARPLLGLAMNGSEGHDG